MTAESLDPARPINRRAIISFAAALVTLLAICTGVVPIPFTGFVCFPSAAVLSVVAVVYGFRALGEIKAVGERGRGIAIAGAIMGSSAILAELCLAVLAVVFWSQTAEMVRRFWR